MLPKSQAGIKNENGHLVVSGDLNFINLVKIWNESLPLINESNQLNFDLMHVVANKSAGLILILEWIKLAKLQNKPITFKNIPSQLISIAEVCGVKNLLASNYEIH